MALGRGDDVEALEVRKRAAHGFDGQTEIIRDVLSAHRQVDALVLLPTAPGDEQEQIVVVEDDLETTATGLPKGADKDESPTNRPPPSVEPEPMLLKPRTSGPPSKAPVRR